MITQDHLLKLISFLNSKFQVDFKDYARSSFQRRIENILTTQGLENINNLIQKIESNKISFTSFLDLLTVNVTELFRNPSFWISYKKELTTLYSKQKKLKIWHAGCSSGEEVFSHLIFLNELGFKEHIKLYASDISPNILKQAENGLIPSVNRETNISNAQEVIPSLNLNKYLSYKKDNDIFNPSLLKNITFIEHDLNTEFIRTNFDIIFCRNVMIYFNNKLQNEILNSITLNLNSNGILCLGQIESLITFQNGHYYQPLDAKEKIFIKINN